MSIIYSGIDTALGKSGVARLVRDLPDQPATVQALATIDGGGLGETDFLRRLEQIAMVSASLSSGDAWPLLSLPEERRKHVRLLVLEPLDTQLPETWVVAAEAPGSSYRQGMSLEVPTVFWFNAWYLRSKAQVYGVTYENGSRMDPDHMLFVLVSPSTLKKFLTGKGNAKGIECSRAVLKRWGKELLPPALYRSLSETLAKDRSSDIPQAHALDALGLAKLAECLLDLNGLVPSLETWTEYQVEALRRATGDEKVRLQRLTDGKRM